MPESDESLAPTRQPFRHQEEWIPETEETAYLLKIRKSRIYFCRSVNTVELQLCRYVVIGCRRIPVSLKLSRTHFRPCTECSVPSTATVIFCWTGFFCSFGCRAGASRGELDSADHAIFCREPRCCEAALWDRGMLD